ncbi:MULTISPECIES: acyltransferase domain-containing protein [unclassified Agrococcus]|uniref:acyltransferase domain-containing protein n=1 Tax=unclassified Agrococcus TaxID=2615065 RepID=UPI00360D7FCB
MTLTADDVRRRLAEAPLDALGLDRDDRTLVDDAIARLTDADAHVVARAASSLLDGIGAEAASAPDPFAGDARLADRAGRPAGALPMLALVATAGDVVAWHRGNGVDAATATSGVADLGQQLRVHRAATGVGGLDTAGWLATPWSGALLRHGALQVAHGRHPKLGWVRSVHIPGGAALDRAAVDASLAEAARVGAEAFPERATQLVHCASWMLDPWLVEALPGTRLAAFAARWDRLPATSDDDGADDALWFVWGRRPPWPARSALPRDTALRRALADRLAAGGRPVVREGVLAR